MATLFRRKPSRGSFDKVFRSLERKAYNIAQQRMTENLPYAAEILHSYAEEALRENEKWHMTGNTINGYGIAIYRNGKFVACATTSDVEGDEPIQVTLANGDVFKKGKTRYDGTVQKRNFKASPDSQRRIWANREVVNWLRRYPPRVKKGRGISSLAYRVVCVVDYAKYVGGRKVMLQFMDDVESRGGMIQEFNLG